LHIPDGGGFAGALRENDERLCRVGLALADHGYQNINVGLSIRGINEFNYLSATGELVGFLRDIRWPLGQAMHAL
jgi:hypothetical protein